MAGRRDHQSGMARQIDRTQALVIDRQEGGRALRAAQGLGKVGIAGLFGHGQTIGARQKFDREEQGVLRAQRYQNLVPACGDAAPGEGVGTDIVDQQGIVGAIAVRGQIAEIARAEGSACAVAPCVVVEQRRIGLTEDERKSEIAPVGGLADHPAGQVVIGQPFAPVRGAVILSDAGRADAPVRYRRCDRNARSRDGLKIALRDQILIDQRHGHPRQAQRLGQPSAGGKARSGSRPRFQNCPHDGCRQLALQRRCIAFAQKDKFGGDPVLHLDLHTVSTGHILAAPGLQHSGASTTPRPTRPYATGMQR